jgi:hypothetical protein
MHKIIFTTLYTFLAISNAFAANNYKISSKEICKAAIATINFKHPREISIEKVDNNIVYLSYIRSSDETKWSTMCKIENNRVVWASIFNSNRAYDILYRKTNNTSTGRWRNNKEDPEITFTAINNLVDIRETYGDGSSTIKSFDINQL